MRKIISLHDVLEPLKQALLASRDVIISSQICASNLQKVFTLGDGCWLPIHTCCDPQPQLRKTLSQKTSLGQPRAIISGKEKELKLKENPRDTSRVSLKHPAGQTGSAGRSQGFPLVTLERLTEEAFLPGHGPGVL